MPDFPDLITADELMNSVYNRRSFGKEVVSKTVAFDGTSGNGAVGTVDLFTVTGDVKLKIFGICTENLAGATATIEVGVTGDTAALIAQTTATDLVAGEAWSAASPTPVAADPAAKIVPNGLDVIATVATANVTDGTITFYCEYEAISSDGVVAAA